jgi:hypothetical protein
MLNIIMSCRLVLNLRAPQSVHTRLGGSDQSSGARLPLYNQPQPPKNFLEMTSQSRGAVTVITTSDTGLDSTPDTHYKH